MENYDLFINLFYNVKEDSFKMNTNVKENKIDDVLFECYRATLNQPSDKSKFHEQEIYNILIKLDLSYDTFNISSDTGNSVLTYELIKDAIGNYEIIQESFKFNRENLETMVLSNKN